MDAEPHAELFGVRAHRTQELAQVRTQSVAADQTITRNGVTTVVPGSPASTVRMSLCRAPCVIC